MRTRPQQDAVKAKLVRAHGDDGPVDKGLQTDGAVFLFLFEVGVLWALVVLRGRVELDAFRRAHPWWWYYLNPSRS